LLELLQNALQLDTCKKLCGLDLQYSNVVSACVSLLLDYIDAGITLST
jgi:hypothetical protein